MSLIVLEGVDGVGKTTLVERLADMLDEDVVIKHCGPPKGDILKEYEWTLATQYRPFDVDMVCDRWHVGERVYGPLLRGASKLTPAMVQHIEMFLQSRGAMRLIIDAPLDTVIARFTKRGDDLVTPEQITAIWDWYRDYAVKYDWAVIDSNITDQHLRQIIENAQYLEKQASVLELWPSYVGPRWPRYLFLGDARNGNDAAHGRPRYPSAFVPYKDTSGHFLLKALEEAGVPRSYGVANACEDKLVTALWTTLGKPLVVTLGHNAFRYVRDNTEVPVQGSVAHPQHVRRFRFNECTMYGQEIKDILDA